MAGLGRDYGSDIADVLVQVSSILESLSADQWESQSLCTDWRIRDVAAHIAFRLGATASEFVSTLLPLLPEVGFRPMRALDVAAIRDADVTTDELVRSIRRTAALKLGGVGRLGLSEATEAVIHGYDIAAALGLPLDIDADLTHAIASRRAALATGTLRGVLGARTFVATDAGWTVGNGSVIEGTAQGVLLYLFGREPLHR